MSHFSFLRFLQLSGKSFPLCMRHLHKALRENHHLRHGGRMQYGLFLKGIGLTLEQALQFWRSEFVKGKVDADKVTLQLQLILHIVLVFHRLTLVQYFCVCSSSLFLCFWFCWCHSLLHPSITLERVTQMNERRYLKAKLFSSLSDAGDNFPPFHHVFNYNSRGTCKILFFCAWYIKQENYTPNLKPMFPSSLCSANECLFPTDAQSRRNQWISRPYLRTAALLGKLLMQSSVSRELSTSSVPLITHWSSLWLLLLF